MYARRACFVLAALAALAPAVTAAQATTARGGNRWSVLVGIEDGPGDSGLQLRGDLEFSRRRLSPVVQLGFVGQVGFTRFSENGGGYNPLTGIDDSWDTSLNLLKFSGSARFLFGNSPTIHPYADAGLGLYYASVSGSQTVYLGYPYYDYVKQSWDDSDIGLFMRLAGGVSFQVSPGFDLGVEVGFQPYFGDYPDDTLTSLLASATFRM